MSQFQGPKPNTVMWEERERDPAVTHWPCSKPAPVLDCEMSWLQGTSLWPRVKSCVSWHLTCLMSFWPSSPGYYHYLATSVKPHCYRKTKKERERTADKRQLESIICSTWSVEQSNILFWESALKAEALQTTHKLTYTLFNNLLNTAYYTHVDNVHILVLLL